jgi:hypothetical protein
VAGARIWDAFHREHELGADEGADPELDHPRDLTQPIRFFYWGKVVAVGLGYLAVFAYLCGAWLTA